MHYIITYPDVRPVLAEDSSPLLMATGHAIGEPVVGCEPERPDFRALDDTPVKLACETPIRLYYKQAKFNFLKLHVRKHALHAS